MEEPHEIHYVYLGVREWLDNRVGCTRGSSVKNLTEGIADPSRVPVSRAPWLDLYLTGGLYTPGGLWAHNILPATISGSFVALGTANPRTHREEGTQDDVPRHNTIGRSPTGTHCL